MKKISLLDMPKTILLVFGLPGSGKTTLSEKIQSLLPPEQCVYFNADKVRSTLSKDLGFSVDARVEQARRMACMASLALDGSSARVCIVDFVNPNLDTWTAFSSNMNRPVGKSRVSDVNRVPSVVYNEAVFPLFSVFMNTIRKEDCRFADTAELFDRNERPVDMSYDKFLTDEEMDLAASDVLKMMLGKQKGAEEFRHTKKPQRRSGILDSSALERK